MLVVAAIVLVLLLSRRRPPRYRRLRGAPQWTTHAEAQRAHLDHFDTGRGPDGEGER